MFDLNDKAVEDIVFAMEDQERSLVVDLETGAIQAREASGDEDRYAAPPPWSSRDGFKIMEDFLALVRQPTARRELQGALSRGRGVFKTFKSVLAGFPDLERAFRDYKLRTMRVAIVAWYDDLREARGLARLGPEPEETQDLLGSDLGLRIAELAELRDELLGLVREIADEALANLPEPIAAFEEARLVEEIEEAEEGLCAVADDGEGGILGAAFALREIVGERSLGRILFVGVREGFRRLGLGSQLLDLVSRRLSSEGVRFLVVDSAFLPPEYGASLSSRGYAAYGARGVARLE